MAPPAASARRPSSPPPPAPPAAAGQGPRFPLFADEASATATREVPTVAPASPRPPSHLAPTPTEPGRSRRLLWGVAAVVVVLLAVFGYWLATGPLGSAPTGGATATGAPGSAGADPGAGSADATDVARGATVEVPATAPPNQDTDGNMVRYEGRNMLDGVPTTCWRMAGDGTGRTITFKLAQPTRLTSVGLINGYAKSATDGAGHELDWYHGDRRVLSVEWSFDDGSKLTQDLGDTRDMQTVDLDHPVTTSTVQLHLVKVSAPGHGPAARDYTPISDVTLLGTPG
ncbi:NADase-type glycan-binding domain-containing protein [Nocardioides panaciterrulae]|uniref:NADase-type glycan-binding domain-containing protein n=1 Tax=Nocardioides panaciterrulae TaxID=661492 RepID=UPI0015CC55F5|nr:hypothetical protein [Nocardioides panaciterrulae]